MKMPLRIAMTAVVLMIFPVVNVFTQGHPDSKRVGTMTDIDGHVYKTVTIGTQVWMAENLKATKYRDGTPIPNVTDGEAWAELTTGACCVYENDPRNAAVYGRMYNFHAVIDGRKLAPSGWHVPTDAEWAALEKFLGGGTTANRRLREAGRDHWSWEAPNVGNNESGFAALPGGVRFDTNTKGDDPTPIKGLFDYIKLLSTWWSSSPSAGPYGEAQSFHIDRDIVRHDPMARACGFYVRCVKD